MIYFVLVVIILLLIGCFLVVKVSITEESLKVQLFNITIFSKKKEKFYRFLKSINTDDLFKQQNIEQEELIIHEIKFLKVSIIFKTIVNNYHVFLSQNIVLRFIFQIAFPVIKNKIDNFSFKYLEHSTNELQIDVKMRVNIYKLLWIFVKGKMMYVSERN